MRRVVILARYSIIKLMWLRVAHTKADMLPSPMEFSAGTLSNNNKKTPIVYTN